VPAPSYVPPEEPAAPEGEESPGAAAPASLETADG
jgi:hypothetical protein